MATRWRATSLALGFPGPVQRRLPLQAPEHPVPGFRQDRPPSGLVDHYAWAPASCTDLPAVQLQPGRRAARLSLSGGPPDRALGRVHLLALNSINWINPPATTQLAHQLEINRCSSRCTGGQILSTGLHHVAHPRIDAANRHQPTDPHVVECLRPRSLQPSLPAGCRLHLCQKRIWLGDAASNCAVGKIFLGDRNHSH